MSLPNTHEISLQLAEQMEALNLAIYTTEGVQQLPFEAVTPEIWEQLQTSMTVYRSLFEFMKLGIQVASPALGNEDLMSHVTTVMLADQ